MKAATVLTCSLALLITPSVSAQLNKDPSPPDGSGGTKCYECIEKACSTAEPGHTGTELCSSGTACNQGGCSSTCKPDGATCEGTHTGMWIVPNGEPLAPAMLQTPTLTESLAGLCA